MDLKLREAELELAKTGELLAFQFKISRYLMDPGFQTNPKISAVCNFSFHFYIYQERSIVSDSWEDFKRDFLQFRELVLRYLPNVQMDGQIPDLSGILSLFRVPVLHVNGHRFTCDDPQVRLPMPEALKEWLEEVFAPELARQRIVLQVRREKLEAKERQRQEVLHKRRDRRQRLRDIKALIRDNQISEARRIMEESTDSEVHRVGALLLRDF